MCACICVSMDISLADQMIVFLYVKKAIIIYILLYNLLFQCLLVDHKYTSMSVYIELTLFIFINSIACFLILYVQAKLLPICRLCSYVPGHLKLSHSKTELIVSPAPHSSASGVPFVSTSQTSTSHPGCPPPPALPASKCSPSFPLKTFQISPLSAAPSPLPLPFVYVTEITSHIISALVHATHWSRSNHAEVSPCSGPGSPFSWVIIFHCRSDLVLLLST